MPAIKPKYEATQKEARYLAMYTTIITFIFYSILFLKHFSLTSKWSKIAQCSSHSMMAPTMLYHDPLLTYLGDCINNSKS